MSRISLSKVHLSGHELPYVKKAFESNQVSVYGENLIAFENDLENFLKEESYVACLSSGTAAIHLALIQLGVSRDDEVICQTFTFCGSANPIIYQGANPIFIDSEYDTWNMCPIHLEEAINSRILNGRKPKAIIIVHLYGMPAKMSELLNIAYKYDIPIIEDAAEALGSIYKGRKCGTFGEYSVLSFNSNKIITTSGGGALVSKSIKEKRQAIFYATQARDDKPNYQHSEIGYNYRMSNVSAGIGRGQMEVLSKYIKQRREMHQFYEALFENIEGINVFKEPNSNYISNHWLTCITIEETKTNITPERLRIKMAEDDIESRPLWKPMHLQPVFKNCLYYGSDVSERLFNKGLCLPSGSNITKSDRDRIKDSILSII